MTHFRISDIFLFFFLVLLTFGIASPVLLKAQQPARIQLLGADKLVYNKDVNPDIRRIVGNVQFRHENAYMRCDSSWQNEKENVVEAFGRVYINSNDTIHLYGNHLHYDGNTKIATMDGKVKLQDNQVTLTTDNLTYDLNADLGSYFNGGKIVGKENTLTSKIGYYYGQRKEFFFRKNVVLVNPKYTMQSDTLLYNTLSDIAYFKGPTYIYSEENTIYCENGWYNTKTDVSRYSRNAWFKNKTQILQGDSLFYDRIKGYGQALHNVTLIDSVENVVLTGGLAEYYELSGYSLLTDSALAMLIDKKDTLFLHADTLKSTFDTTGIGKHLYAYKRAKFYKTDIQGRCDSLVYVVADSTIFMYQLPLLYADENQLAADTIVIQIGKSSIRQIWLKSQAFIISQDAPEQFNQVKGKLMTGFFYDNQLKKMDVHGSVESLYFIRDELNNLIGVNKAEASDLTVYLDSNVVVNLTFKQEPHAVLYPLKDLSSKDLQLKGFRWEIARRPQRKEDVFSKD